MNVWTVNSVARWFPRFKQQAFAFAAVVMLTGVVGTSAAQAQNVYWQQTWHNGYQWTWTQGGYQTQSWNYHQPTGSYWHNNGWRGGQHRNHGGGYHRRYRHQVHHHR